MGKKLTESDIITMTATWAWSVDAEVLWYFNEYPKDVSLLARHFKQQFCKMVDELAADFTSESEE